MLAACGQLSKNKHLRRGGGRRLHNITKRGGRGRSSGEGSCFCETHLRGDQYEKRQTERDLAGRQVPQRVDGFGRRAPCEANAPSGNKRE